MNRPGTTRLGWVVALGLAAAAGSVQAMTFTLPAIDEETIEAVMNVSVTAGVGVRMQERSADLVSKSGRDPELCGRVNGRTFFQSCQGLFRTQAFPSQRLADIEGQYGTNADNGNWNYDKGDLTQAPLKVSQDLTLNWGNWGLFARALYFYDFVNHEFTERNPNRITSENLDRVGYASHPGEELLFVPAPVPTLSVRSDSRPCPADRNPSGGPCGLVYGPGAPVRQKRRDGETLRQIGSDLQLLDLSLYGSLDLPWDKSLTVKIGRQTLNWGESTLLVFDSLNSVNPINANNFFRVGSAVEEIFTPVGMVFLSTELFDGASLEAFYQYEWEPAEAPAMGSFFSFVDVGTNNAGDSFNLGFGGGAEDPERVGRLLDNPLSGLTATTGAIVRLEDREPRNGGQYGAALKYYAEWLNQGTELGLYYLNYHARLPYASFISAPRGCAENAHNTEEFLLGCNDVPLFHATTDPNNPAAATDDALNFDKIKVFLEYPENIQLYGLSFNTTAGAFSIQGEVAYRPDAPLQVDVEDLGFAALGAAGGTCHLRGANCAGTGNGSGLLTGLAPAIAGELGAGPQQLANQLLAQLSAAGLPAMAIGGIGTYRDPADCSQTANGPAIISADNHVCIYPSSDFVIDAAGTPGDYRDTYDLLVGHAPGPGRSFPSFVIPYRGGVLGQNPPESYVRGWEHFDTYEFTLGATHVMGATDSLAAAIGADQIIWLFEAGATWVPDLPPLDELQLDAPGTFTHASAGADGSGSDRTRQACSANEACSFGADGLRFNPHQQDLDLYPDKFSAGYDVIALIKYESVLPNISLQPLLIWKHDVHGTAPGIASNFVEGRKLMDALLEVRYQSQLSFNLGYTWFTGGGSANLLRDRDQARFFVKYQF